MSSGMAPRAARAAADTRGLEHQPPIRRVVKTILRLYMRPFHGLELLGLEHVPSHGPALIVVNHASLLDVPALMLVDPFPDTATVVKASMFRMPLIGWL